jgi:hypothetical protein
MRRDSVPFRGGAAAAFKVLDTVSAAAFIRLWRFHSLRGHFSTFPKILQPQFA